MQITGETTVGQAICQKGVEAGRMMDDFFCVRGCCARTTQKLEYAANIANKASKLPALLRELNGLPDVNA